MMRLFRLAAPAVIALGLAASFASPGLAQSAGSPFAGFSANKGKPINFEADRVDVYDNEHKAILTGNAKIVQGESTLIARKITIYYDDNETTDASGKKKSSGQSVSRMEMEGGVIVRSKNQTATSEEGNYEAKANAAILTRNVVLTQCGNVMKGEKMFADLAANRVRMDAGQRTSSTGRVSGLLNSQGGSGDDCSGSSAPAAPAAPARRN